jgi:hypothetical protein
MINHKNSSPNSKKSKSITDAEFIFSLADGIEIKLTAKDLQSFKSPVLDNVIDFNAWGHLVKNSIIPYQSNTIKYELEGLIDSYDEYMYNSDITRYYHSLLDTDEHEPALKSIHATFKGKFNSVIEKLEKDKLISYPYFSKDINDTKSSWVNSDNGLIQETQSFKLTISVEQTDEIFTYIADHFKEYFEITERKVNEHLACIDFLYSMDFLKTQGVKVVDEFSNKEPSAEGLKELIKALIKDARFFDFFGTENSEIKTFN